MSKVANMEKLIAILLLAALVMIVSSPAFARGGNRGGASGAGGAGGASRHGNPTAPRGQRGQRGDERPRGGHQRPERRYPFRPWGGRLGYPFYYMSLNCSQQLIVLDGSTFFYYEADVCSWGPREEIVVMYDADQQFYILTNRVRGVSVYADFRF